MSKRKLPSSQPAEGGAAAAGGTACARAQLFGPRIPYQFFVTSGFGQTNEGGGVDPWETGSFDLALEDAGIQDFNIVQYTSVIPPESKEVPFDAAVPFFHHGAVLESITAEMNGCQGDRISAGVGRMKIRRKRDGAWVGGYAAEYKGHATEDTVKRILRADLNGIFKRRFDAEQYEIAEESFCVRVGEVEKGYGTVITCICFVSYITPVLETPQGLKEEIGKNEETAAEGAKEVAGGSRRRRFF